MAPTPSSHGVQERAEHAALRGAGVESQGGGCGGAYPHSLGSACQEVQDPITEGGVEPKVPELSDELGGHNGIECCTVVNDRHFHIPYVSLWSRWERAV